MQQHIAASGQVLGFGVLDLVVADAILAGHKDHRGGRHAMHIDGVMPGAADDVHVVVVQGIGRAAHAGHAVGVEDAGRKAHHLFDGHLALALGSQLRKRAAHGGVHRIQPRLREVAKIHAELDLAGDHIAGVGQHLQMADGAAPVRCLVQRDAVDGIDHAGSGQHGVMAQVHRRGAGMRVHAGDGYVIPLLAQRAADDANRLVIGFEDRALLDMRLKVSGKGAPGYLAAGHIAQVADAGQLIAHGEACTILLRADVVCTKNSRKCTRAHHHRREARAFLVHPEGHFQRRDGLYAVAVERAHHLQAGEHAVVAIELASRGLGVDMAAGGHGACLWVGACAAAKHIAHFIHAHLQACVAEPLHHLVAAGLVLIGQGDAADAAFGRGPYLGQGHQRLPEAVFINAQAVYWGHAGTPESEAINALTVRIKHAKNIDESITCID